MVQPKQKTNKTPRSYPVVVRKTLDCIVRGYAPQKIWLFGSYARGDFHQGSDLDLIIVKDTPARFLDRIEEVLDHVPGGIAVEPLVYTPGELATMLAERNTFMEQALSEGVLVYEQ